jgi:hypothetical protein
MVECRFAARGYIRLALTNLFAYPCVVVDGMARVAMATLSALALSFMQVAAAARLLAFAALAALGEVTATQSSLIA